MSEVELNKIIMDYAVKFGVELTKQACESLGKSLFSKFINRKNKTEIEETLKEYGFKERVSLVTDALFTFNSNGGIINFNGVNINSNETVYNSIGGKINITDTTSATPGTKIIVGKGARIEMCGNAKIVQGVGSTFNANPNGILNFGS